MPTDGDIRDVEIARLESIVAADGREDERSEVEFMLLLTRFMERPPDLELLGRVARRVERRALLGLPAVACAGRPPTERWCSCLDKALDESDDGKRAVLKLAGRLHWSPPPRVERRLEQEEKPAAVPAAHSPNGDSKPPQPPAKPDPRPRIVRHFKRWYDDDGDFTRMKF
jgi:hypothetical protein